MEMSRPIMVFLVAPFEAQGTQQSTRKIKQRSRVYFTLDDFYYNTSSTAQGGGGSVKDRKPVGEVGCCESWTAEPGQGKPTDGYPFVDLSIFPSIDLSIYSSIWH